MIKFFNFYENEKPIWTKSKLKYPNNVIFFPSLFYNWII